MKQKIFIKTKQITLKCLPLLILYVVITLAFSAIQGYLGAVLIANVIDFVNEKEIRLALIHICLYAVYLFMINSIPNINNLLFTNIRNKINNATLFDIFSKVDRSMLISFENDNWLSKFDRITGLNGVVCDLVYTSTMFLSQIFLFLSYFIYLYRYLGANAVVYLLIIVPALIKSVIFSSYYTKLKRSMSSDVHMERRYFDILTNPIAMSEAKLFQSDSYLYKKWRIQYENNFKTYFNADKKFFYINLLCNIAVTGIAIATGLQLFFLLDKGIITLGVTLTIIPFINKIICSSDVTMQNLSSIFLTIIEYKDIISFYTAGGEKCEDELIKKQDIDIVAYDLSFHYPNSNNCILDHVSFEIQSGQTVAIVGVNGAGKSTLLKILAGFYQPISGMVQYSGQDIHNVCEQHLKDVSAFVFQQPVKYPETFKENILVNNKDNDSLQRQLLYELDRDFLNMLSSEQILYPGFSNSRDISGGQWQKVAFLRSMQKESEMFFFDEPTASLDPISEVKLFELFKQNIQGKTVVMATHRLGLARKADRIIVLDNKKIVGIGTHGALLESCPVYKELYDLQSMWYRGGHD